MDDVTASGGTPWLPPRWFVRLAWIIHRAIHRLTGGRRGLAVPRPGKAGYLRLHTVGRRSGLERQAIVAYYEDGPDLVTLAMNGWADPSRRGGSTCSGTPTRGSTSRAALAPSARTPRKAMNGRDSGRASMSTRAGGPTSTPLPGSDRERRRWSSSSRAPSPPELVAAHGQVVASAERRPRGLAADPGSLRFNR